MRGVKKKRKKKNIIPAKTSTLTKNRQMARGILLLGLVVKVMWVLEKTKSKRCL